MRQKKSLYKILAQRNEKRKKYLKNCLFYVKRLKKLVRKCLPDARVLLFGSMLFKGHGMNSDIDVLIISSKVPERLLQRAKIIAIIKSNFTKIPFEIHLASPDEYENWYKNFIKNGYKEV